MDTPSVQGIQVFSATMAKDRAVLGERVTAWSQANPNARVIETIVRQSSDAGFHCLSIVLLWSRA
jgi:hypothetical protein